MNEVGAVGPVSLDSPNSTHRDEQSPHVNGSAKSLKRSRTPENRLGPDGVPSDSEDDAKPRKHGRLTKGSRPPQSPSQTEGRASTPQNKTKIPLHDSPSQLDSTAATPARNPTHASVPLAITSTDLVEDKSGLVEIEHDENGEKKVTETGHLTGGREYRCRTFHLPNRGHKLFMLATECARVLVFRDSYLLFIKNKSLHKIIATLSDKEGLIKQGILPYSYRSRNIALVTARSMYRQFGSKMIVDGRRVKDDYWEAAAKAQGFTEEDYAIERKVIHPPKASKEAGPGTDVSSVGQVALKTLAQGEIVYQKADPSSDPPPPVHELVMTDTKSVAGDYGHVARPRQDITGAPPYEDKVQASLEKEIVDQAAQASQFNQACAEQAKNRRSYFKDYYLQPRKAKSPPPTAAAMPRPPDPAPAPMPQQRYPQPSPQHRRESHGLPASMQHPMQHQMPHQANPSHVVNQQNFARPQHVNMPGGMHPSPAPHQMPGIRRDSTTSHMPQAQHRSGYPYNPTAMGHQTPQPAGNMYNPYGAQGNAMWPSQHAASPSPHPQQQQQQPQQSPFPQQPHNVQNMQASPAPMNFGGQGPLNGLPQGYPRLPQGVYQPGMNPGFMGAPQQQQLQHRGQGMGQMSGHAMGAHGGMHGFPGMGQPPQQQQQQQQMSAMGWGGGGGY